jgi:phosphohistidine phosphatase
MAKHLLLVRHGKSDWSNFGQADFDRTLNNRGKENAKEMAERLLAKNFKFDLMVSSPAKRALKTAKYFAKTFNYNIENINFQESVYEANTTALLNVITNFDDNTETIIMFGHNPGFTDLVNQLCDATIYNIPTAGMVYMEFPFESWKMVSRGTGDLKFFDYPKNSDEM